MERMLELYWLHMLEEKKNMLVRNIFSEFLLADEIAEKVRRRRVQVPERYVETLINR